MTESDVGILLGLISIAISILVIGVTAILRINAFAGKLLDILGRLDTKTDQLAPISENVVAVRQSVQNLFQMSSTFFSRGQSGTVTVQLEHLGKTRVSAEPELNSTKYDIKVSTPILDSGLIDKLSKDTGFEKFEIEAFAQPMRLLGVGHDRLILTLPSTDARICAEFTRRFLEWLDSTYVEERQKTLDAFEKPIVS